MPNPVMLFHNGDLRTALEEHDNGIGQEVEAAPERHVLQADEIEWAKALAARYNVDAPVLREDDIWMDEPQPVQVDV